MQPVDTKALVYSRKSFGAAAALVAATQPLVALYAALVRLELTLKDHDPPLRHKSHNIPFMLDHFQIDSSIRVQFENALGSLWVTQKDPNASATNARAASYPDIRYLRHAADHGPVNATDDAALVALLNLVQQSIEPALRSQGIDL